MNPLANVQYPTSTQADLDRLQQLCEQLAGFDERISLEWLDGAMTALAAGPRLVEITEWRETLIADAWSRAFADPQAQAQATAVLRARWLVLRKQLDPQLLQDAPEELRLAPVMLEWSDEDKVRLVEEGHIGADDVDDEVPLTGEVWAHGFMEVLQAFAQDWPQAEGEGETAVDDFVDDCSLRVLILAVRDPPEFAKMRQDLYPDEADKMTRENLIQEALYAVQDLRVHWVENAPKPQTVRVDAKPGRNEPCTCGSGKKFKKCHGA